MKNALTGESKLQCFCRIISQMDATVAKINATVSTISERGMCTKAAKNGNEHRNSKHHFIFDCAGCAVYFIHRKGAKDGGSHQNDRRYVRIE